MERWCYQAIPCTERHCFGGDSDNGTVFALNTDGTGFKTLHSFTSLAIPLPQLTINPVGANLLVAWPMNRGR